MTFRRSRSGYLHSALAAGLAGLALVAGGCATDGASANGSVYGGYDYDDAWYWGGCCVDPPQAIGPPPHPDHPIAKPPPAGPSHPIATPPVSRPMPMPRPAAAPRGGRR